jgi:membrane associated rhomboid family serine protease
MASPELFVVCKNCQSQVSPYITECPYCGTRLRKRAPKIERDELAPKAEPRRRPERRERRRGRAKPPRQPLGGRIGRPRLPGTRGDELGRPVATIALVLIGALWWLALVPMREQEVALVVSPLDQWWSVLTAPFVHASGWYQFAGLGSVAVFGWLLERKHGSLPMLIVWLLGASGGMAIVKLADPEAVAMGATGGALALLCAWAVPILLERRRTGDRDDDVDMLGAGVIFVLLALLPAAREEISVLATAAGVVIGSLCGLVLTRVARD